jgi:hypothetical protein
MNSKKSPTKSRKRLHDPIFLAIISVFSVIILWIIFTVFIPLLKGDGVDKYSGLPLKIAQDMVVVTQDINGPPNGPTMIPDSMYRIHIDEVRPVSEEEIIEFCKNPGYITSDPNKRHYYTVVVTEQYLFSPSSKTTRYVGCDHTDYIYTRVFDYPDGLDPRVEIR